MANTDEARLRELAEAATPSEWRVIQPGSMPIIVNGPRMDDRLFDVSEKMMGGFRSNANADAEFVAAANPTVVLSLLAELSLLREQRDELRAELNKAVTFSAARCCGGRALVRTLEERGQRMSCDCYCHVNPSATCTVDTGSTGVPGKPSCSPCDIPQARYVAEPGTGEKPADDGPKLAGPKDLWRAIDSLTNPIRQRLKRDHGNYEHITLPSLLDQLVEAMESGAGQQTGSMQESKAPCDASALSLLIRISDDVRWGCRRAKVKRSFDTAKDLRALASELIRQGDVAVIDAAVQQVKSWCGQIRATISSDPDRTWRMHGAACRVCQSTTVPVYDEDGTETRQPALMVHSAEGVIQKVECAFCGSILEGHDLTKIVSDTLNEIARATTAKTA